MSKGKSRKVAKTDDEWRAQLDPMQFKVTRKGGTERAFTGATWDEKRAGRYDCVCCGRALFDAGAKYKSGTGWPSFYRPIDGEAVDEEVDYKLFSKRTEIVCMDCGAHLGHVFPDGPAPTGQRYCMNSAALNFVPEAE